MKVKEIDLFGEKVLLSELTGEDFFVLKQFSDGKMTPEKGIQANYLGLSFALNINIKPVPPVWKWRQYRKVKAWNRLFTQRYLFTNVGLLEAGDFLNEVFALSGLDFQDVDKKKAKGQGSQEKSPEV